MYTRRTFGKLVGATAGLAVVGTKLTTDTMAQEATATPEVTPAPYAPAAELSKLEGTITADGSSTVGPITEAVAEEFGALAEGVEITVDISGTGGGFKRFCAGETDLQNASRKIKDEELQLCKDGGVEFYAFEVAYDGITVVVNPENDWVDCLTVDQLKSIWNKDSTVTKWSDLDPSFPGDAMTLYGPGTDSGTFDFFTKAINGEEGVARTDFTPSEDDNVLVQGVAGDKNAMAFFGYAYFAQNEDSLKELGVDNGAGCIVPTVDTIRDGSYAPLSRPLYVYINAESIARPEVQEFMRFYLATAMELVEEVGYVDSPADVIVADQTKLEAAIAGTAKPDNAE